MAINSTYYLNAVDLVSATSVYLDSALTLIAPDGFYGDGFIGRQQLSGVLQTAEVCGECLTPCGTSLAATGGEGIYLINLNAGTNVGALVIRFFPQSVPDGIRVIYDGITYNKLSSPVYGWLQSPDPNAFTIVGQTTSTGTCSSWYPAGATLNLNEFAYNGTSFVSTGNTQSIAIASTDAQLTPFSPEFCTMVIPKVGAGPIEAYIQVIGPCTSTSWDITVECPAELQSTNGSDKFSDANINCSQALSSVYYFVSVANSPASFIGLYDYIFLDSNGLTPIDDGFYLVDNITAPNKVIEVANGIVIAITNCI